MFRFAYLRASLVPLSQVLKKALRKESGVIDLASIMVGTIVTGLIGGVVASTVFVVIPWTQDNAAKQQLTSIVAAESAYFGLSADPQSSVAKTNSFANSTELQNSNLMGAGKTFCVATPPDGKGYEAFSKSETGKIWLVTDKEQLPVPYTGALPYDCRFIVPPYVDPTPKITKMTYKCDTDITGSIPMYDNLNGTETWSDGVKQTYTAASGSTARTFTAGVTYTMTFEGTYRAMNASGGNAANLSGCLLSVDHWGMNTGLIDATSAFYNARKLTSVPEHIPPTLDLMNFMFYGAHVINDPNISKWDVSNVRQMTAMFTDARAFNQPIGNWNVSKVTRMELMFRWAGKFNQPLNNWNVSAATNMQGMFAGATSFNQPLNHWKVNNVTNMQDMFASASVFNQPIGNWNVSNVTNMKGMFDFATAFNQPIGSWNVSNVVTMNKMFHFASNFNQPLNTWNTVKVTDMTQTFYMTKVFNQNISMWNLAGNPISTDFRSGSALTAANSPFGV